MTAPITFSYAAILGILFVILSIRVIKHRFKTQVVVGDGGNHGLQIAIRTHANFSEYIPLALILIMGVELHSYPSALVHGLGIALVLARLGHVLGLATKNGVGLTRPVGVIATLSILVACAIMILIKSF